MTPRRFISLIITIVGLLTLGVGCLHFVMMGHLTELITEHVTANDTQLVVGSFTVNHVGTGIFLILLGVIVTQSSIIGLRQGKRWARNITMLFGFALCILAAALWISVPPSFLQAVPFRWALIVLTLAGALAILPFIFFYHHFNEL